MPERYLITGATGFIGGHVIDGCSARGHVVRALSRRSSDSSALAQSGVEVIRGETSDPQVVARALDKVDVVVHCAAKVGDRGPAEEYRPANVEMLRTLLEACKGRPLSRFVHISSLGVYEARHHYGTDEQEPLPTNHIDAYTQTKAEADQLALAYHRDSHIPVVVLRPGFVYGPRDRVVLPKLIKRLKEGRFNYLGGDQRALNTIYVGNLVDAVFLAVEKPEAVGRAYNLTDDERVTKQRFIDGIADALSVPRPKQLLPRWLAAIAAGVMWRQIRRAGMTGRPWVTPAVYKFLQLNLDFSVAKAKRELGYRPKTAFDEAMIRTMAWYRENT
jgi:nucleoside-diphosphate-sugar epimerase